jgi:hemolysin activation/secretion protein
MRATLPYLATILAVHASVRASGREAEPPPAVDKSEAHSPLLGDEIRLIPVAPSTPSALPNYRLGLAPDTLTPVLPRTGQLERTAAPDPDHTGPLQIRVNKFEFTGNTVFSNAHLARLLASYTGRTLTEAELEAARIAVTREYVDAGYINSGAVLPDQDVDGGTIRLEIVEGRLSEVQLEGNRWFRTWWLKSQLRHAAGTPVNFNTLKTGLQLLRQNPGISRINAELKPGALPGEGILHTAIKDEHPFRLDMEIANKRPPSVGEGAAEFRFADLNLLGLNDPLELRWGAAHATKDAGFYGDGIENVSVNYEFPVTPWGTALGFNASRGNSGVLDETFAALNIQSRSEEAGLRLRQQLVSTLGNSVSTTLSAVRKHSETSLLGAPFSLSPGASDGDSDVLAGRFAVEWTNRTPVQVFSLRSTLSRGFHGLGSSDASKQIPSANGAPIPDSSFTAWLNQAQYIRRIFDSADDQHRPNTLEGSLLRNTLVILRLTTQLSDKPLLSLEQFSLGGAQSIRGYRENQILRDNGVFASAEVRVPLWSKPDREPVVSLAPFFDIGNGWDSHKTNDGSQTLASAGAGLLLRLSKRSEASLYWGAPLVRLQKSKTSLQDYGIHFQISVSAF